MTDTAGPRVGAVVVPLKSFARAKERLAAVLSPADRDTLARLTAEQVIRAALRLPNVQSVYVAADDQQGADWADGFGAHAIVETGGLNPSVQAAYRKIGTSVDWVMVCHADLVHADRLASLPTPGDSEAIIVRDRHQTGTNVLIIPAGSEFTFRYGAGSADRHHAECLTRGLRPVEVLDAMLGVDIDTPEDLAFVPDWLRPALGLGT